MSELDWIAAVVGIECLLLLIVLAGVLVVLVQVRHASRGIEMLALDAEEQIRETRHALQDLARTLRLYGSVPSLALEDDAEPPAEAS